MLNKNGAKVLITENSPTPRHSQAVYFDWCVYNSTHKTRRTQTP